MSENTRPGREPYELITVKQDFCNLTWSEGACYAGRSNLIPNSSDLSDADYWDSLDWIFTLDAASDPDGGNGATLLERDDTLGAEIVADPGVPRGMSSETIYFSMYAKVDSGISTINITINISGSNETISFNFSAGTYSYGGSSFTTIRVDDAGDDWYRITAAFPSANFGFAPNFFIAPIGASIGETMLVYGLQMAYADNQDYLETTGEPVNPTGTQPCFNTRATCQVPDVYDRGELALKFSKNQRSLLKGEYVRPFVESVSITPGKINPGGAASSSTALGERAQLSVTLSDHPDTDRLVDKYLDQRDYDPLEQGTFASKWRARNPYYMHREIVYESGYLVDGQLVDSISRAFFITGFSGPDSSGRFQFDAKDVLTFAQNDKAKAPFASKGKLDGDITDVAASATLTPAGIGDEEYPAGTFKVRIGKEVIEVSRSAASDVLSLDTRGTDGTDPEEHGEGDTVQLCLEYTSQKPQDILYDLLLNYAGIPDAFLDKAQWDAEQLNYLPNLYSTIITEPTGVSKLVSEMCEQMYFTTWFDERDSLVKMRAVRPAEGDAVYELNDESNLLEDSIRWKDKASELITQVWVYYGRINAAEKLDETSNYAVLDVIASPDSEGADRNNISRVKTIFSRWIPSTGGGTAIDLGNRILARYASAPRECTFTLDAKDRELWLADFVRLTNRLRTDFYGNPVPVSMQVYGAQEAVAGSHFTYKAQEYVEALTDGNDVNDPNIRNIVIAADTLNVNLRTLHDSLFTAPTGTETVTVTIRNGVTIGGYATDDAENIAYPDRDDTNDFYNGGTGSVSGLNAGQIPILQRRGIGSLRTTASGSAYPGGGGNADFEIREYPISTALDTGTWPVGVTLSLVIEGGGRILGEGGNGSTHGLSGTASGAGTIQVKKTVSGADGGNAMNVQYPIAVTNGGIIASGGGGGGFAFQLFGLFLQGVTMTPGGGGAGLEISDTSNNKFRDTANLFPQKREPSIGSTTSGGAGGLAKESGANYYSQGGDGGDLAESGLSGVWRDSELGTVTSGSGGTAGDAIASGADLVTWINKGDVRGAENI